MSRVAEPITAADRMLAEIAQGLRRGAIELAVAFGAVLLLGGGALGRGALVASTLLAWLFIYLASCWLFPLRACGRCGGEGRPRTGDGRGNWRDKVCPRCRGGKERRRWGARLLGRGAPDRHDEKA